MEDSTQILQAVNNLAGKVDGINETVGEIVVSIARIETGTVTVKDCEKKRIRIDNRIDKGNALRRILIAIGAIATAITAIIGFVWAMK